MSTDADHSHRTGSLYGLFAFVSVVLSCFAGYFFYTPRFYNTAAMVPVTFGLGAVYLVLGALVGDWCIHRGSRGVAGYYLTQCALLTVMVFASPIRGFFGIIVLPVVSQAIFDLRPRWAATVVLYLLAVIVAVWAIPFGLRSGLEAIVNYSAGFAFTIVFTIITKQALVAREREAKLRQEVEAANALLRAHAAQTEDLATTRERNRVAREIHDGVGHYLAVVKTQLDAAAALIVTRPDEARAAVDKAARLTGEALEDVRRSVGTLRTDTARLPLPEAVRQLAALGAPVPTVTIEGSPRPLPPAVEHALFRATQEGLTNIRKHARATSSLVRLDYRAPGWFRLELADNGVGAGANPAGFGLTGLRERIEVLGGKVETAVRAGGGFALTIEVPA